jgi:hypothetical protein
MRCLPEESFPAILGRRLPPEQGKSHSRAPVAESL